MDKTKKDLKRLYRSKEDKIIAGVCGGIAEYFNIDPVWIRLTAVLLLFADGIGLILYILAWILVPSNPAQKEGKKTKAEKIVERAAHKKDKASSEEHANKRKPHLLFGLIFIFLGITLTMKNLFSWFDFRYIWSLAILAFGIYLLVGRSR